MSVMMKWLCAELVPATPFLSLIQILVYDLRTSVLLIICMCVLFVVSDNNIWFVMQHGGWSKLQRANDVVAVFSVSFNNYSYLACLIFSWHFQSLCQLF